MKTVVTGSAGYIGSHVVLALLRAGHEVVGIDRDADALIPPSSRLKTYEIDVVEPKALGAVMAHHRPDAVIHCAMRRRAKSAFADPLDAYRRHLDGTRCVIDAAARAGVEHLVMMSDSSIYGRGGPSLDEDEAGETAPRCAHGRSMMAAEWLAGDAARAMGMEATILRLFDVAGADAKGQAHQEMGHPAPVTVAVAKAAGERSRGFDIYGSSHATRDGTCERDYVHVSDAADAFVCAAERSLSAGGAGALNVGSGRGTTIIELVQTAERVSGRTVHCTNRSRRFGDLAIVRPRTDRTAAKLNWIAKRSLDEILADTIASVEHGPSPAMRAA